jgi:hypothetical protein
MVGTLARWRSRLSPPYDERISRDHTMTGNLARAESTLAPAMPMRTIDGPAAWRGSGFKDPDAFTHRLTGDEIAEIDAAVRAIIESRIDHIAIDRGNFALPRLGKRLARIRDDVLLGGRGFIVFRGLPVERYRWNRRRRPSSASARISASRCRKTARAISWVT